MSRPRWSVPIQWAAVGGASVSAASVAMGSWVWMRLAKTAITMITSMTMAPAPPSGFFRKNRITVGTRPSRRARAPACAGSATPTTARSAGIADARIEDAVQHVHDEVGHDHHDGDEHDEVLHDGVVAPEDGLDQEARHAGQVEHGLGDDETADQERELDTDDRHDRQDRVLERVAPDDVALPLALGPGRADVILAHDLEEGRAGDPHHEGRGAVADRQRRQQELHAVERKVLEGRDVGHRGNPAYPRDQDQDDD